ncbi:hypothetical protein [Phenylobacterium sp.]|uniref:hypothetical protein n=1 Tax=Phenylobacterium sp. TaxID=1871053 RepID=UPI002F4252CA
MTFSTEIGRKPRPDATARFTRGTVIFLAAAIPLVAAFAFWNHKHQMLVAWDIRGPACPLARHAWSEIALHRQPHTFKYGGADFAHVFGAARCASVPHGHALSREADYVCQFTRPAMIAVTTADGRKVLFEPGYERQATVALRGGALSCVVGGWLQD